MNLRGEKLPDTNRIAPVETEKSQSNRIDSLTSLRFLAALGIYFYHANPHFKFRGSDSSLDILGIFSDIGFLGVPFFFQLSGFILTVVYEPRAFETSFPQAAANFKLFMIARIARIYPLYLLALITSFILVPFDASSLKLDIGEIGVALILTPLLLQAWFPKIALLWNPPGWSLSVELLFYLSFPVILKLLAKKKTRDLIPVYFYVIGLAGFTTILLTILSPVLGAAGPFLDPAARLHNFSRYFPLIHLPTFISGIILGLLYRQNTKPFFGLLSLAAKPIITILLFILPSIVNYLPYLHWHNWLLIPFFSLVIFVTAKQNKTSWILRSKPLVLLGEASYGFYLFHITILRLYSKLLQYLFGYKPLGIAHAIVCLIIACGFSIITFLCFERPARRYIIQKYR